MKTATLSLVSRNEGLYLALKDCEDAVLAGHSAAGALRMLSRGNPLRDYLISIGEKMAIEQLETETGRGFTRRSIFDSALLQLSDRHRSPNFDVRFIWSMLDELDYYLQSSEPFATVTEQTTAKEA